MHPIAKSRLSAALSICIGLGTLPAVAVDQAAIDKLHAQAVVIASQPGEDLHNIAWLCDFAHRPGNLTAGGDPPPQAIFDNLYFLGTGFVTSWAVKTNAGIILFDTLDNPQEADKYILGGMKKLGLDPMSIKYIVVTHAHGDHFGGARDLQDKIPGVHLLMGAKDWDVLATNPPQPKPASGLPEDAYRGGPLPKRDMNVTDGQKLTLGDETVTLYLTPGHTPGTVSAIIPVTDHGKPMNVALWGGMPYSKDGEAIFMASLKRFRTVMADEHVVGRLSNHPLWDNSIIKLYLHNNNRSGPSPYIETASDMKRYAQIQDICLKARHIQYNTP